MTIKTTSPASPFRDPLLTPEPAGMQSSRPIPVCPTLEKTHPNHVHANEHCIRNAGVSLLWMFGAFDTMLLIAWQTNLKSCAIFSPLAQRMNTSIITNSAEISIPLRSQISGRCTI